MRKVVRLTENDLSRLVRRVIREQHQDYDIAPGVVFIQNKSEREVSKALNNLSESVWFLTIANCEYADFSNIDICELRDLAWINLKGTDNNFDEQGYECFSQVGQGLYAHIEVITPK